MAETESKTEENSTTPAIDIGGSEPEGLEWIDSEEVPASAEPPSEKKLDTPESPAEDGVSGEMRVLLMEDETVRVSFPRLGRWTPGRLEKAMSRIFHECMLARQRFGRKADGLPEVFNTGNEGQ